MMVQACVALRAIRVFGYELAVRTACRRVPVHYHFANNDGKQWFAMVSIHALELGNLKVQALDSLRIFFVRKAL